MTITTDAGLLRLLSWLSPAFPVGAFGFSHGLETAIRDGRIGHGADLQAWISGLLQHGGGWTDAVLFAAAWSAAHDRAALQDVADLGEALAPSLERRRESLGQGEAFMIAVAAWGAAPLTGQIPYCVAVGATAAHQGVPLDAALIGWLHAFAANLVSVAVRAVPLGQNQGVAVIAALEPVILAVAARAAASSLDDLGSAALLSDIAAMRHETLDGRLFVS